MQYKGVNALNGLISFLLGELPAQPGSATKCVNALNGLISFLLGDRQHSTNGAGSLCQCPKRANFISTHKYEHVTSYRRGGVSMP